MAMKSLLEQTLALPHPAPDPAVASSHSKTALATQAYREYCAQVSAGEQVDPDEFCGRYPALHTSLVRLVQAHLFLEQNSHLIGGASIMEASPRLASGAAPARWPSVGS